MKNPILSQATRLLYNEFFVNAKMELVIFQLPNTHYMLHNFVQGLDQMVIETETALRDLLAVITNH